MSKSNFNIVTRKFEFFANQKTVQECVDHTEYPNFVQTKYVPSSSFIENKKCQFAEKLSSGKYLCLGCVPGFAPRMGLITFSRTFSDISDTQRFGVIDCVPQTEFTSKFEGLGLEAEIYEITYSKSLGVKYSDSQFLYESCVDPNKKMMLFLQGSNGKLYDCISESDIKSPTENCHMYQWGGGGSVDLNSSNPLNWQCIACAPGYSPGFGKVAGSSIDRIVSCNLIVGCDSEHPRNTWMNTCAFEALREGYGYEAVSKDSYGNRYIYNSQITEFDVELDPDCLVKTSNKTGCDFCKKGFYFHVDLNKCVPMDLENCKSKGFYKKVETRGFTSESWVMIQSLMGISELLSSMHSLDREFWAQDLHSILSFVPGFFCDSCQDGYVKVSAQKNDRTLVCSNLKLGYSIDHCEVYSSEFINLSHPKCARCKDGYILTSSWKCRENNFDSLCIQIKYYDSIESRKCTSCKEGYYLNPTTQKCFPIVDSNCLVDYYGGTGEGIISNSDYFWLEGNPTSS
jgi:hypothetical protein